MEALHGYRRVSEIYTKYLAQK